MLTVVETPTFQKLWPNYWTEEERGAFAAYISENPHAGDLVQKSGGVRKVRWSRAGFGKSGGVRVLYFSRKKPGEVVLLLIYAKANLDSISGETLKELRDAAEKAVDQC
ncbi:transcriptional regulator [Variovorax boronicumulans]|uniref:transcriptional regulator n=1 Tax=Variovorax boronicumulans TaxID=436515 RepID=UPI003394E914